MEVYLDVAGMPDQPLVRAIAAVNRVDIDRVRIVARGQHLAVWRECHAADSLLLAHHGLVNSVRLCDTGSLTLAL